MTIAGRILAPGSGLVPCTACVGGTLTLNVPKVAIGPAASASGGAVALTPDFFGSGFSSYTIDGQHGLSVAAGTSIVVTQPVQQFTPGTALLPSGTDPAAAFTMGLPALYTPNLGAAALVQRPGASLTLRAVTVPTDLASTDSSISIGAGAAITVDPGRAIRLEALGQITIDGTLRAPGGTISVFNDRFQNPFNSVVSFLPNLSVWLGPSSVLDVGAAAAAAVDRFGRTFGLVPDGGSIQIGGPGGSGSSTTDAYVIVRPGAVLSAAGTSAVIDPAAGSITGTSSSGRSPGGDTRLVASNGGSISLSSESGLSIEGQLSAPSGGGTAQGGAQGALSVSLVTPDYTQNAALAGALPAALACLAPWWCGVAMPQGRPLGWTLLPA